MMFCFQGCMDLPDTKEVDSEKKYLIVNGDDLFKNETTSQAIITAYREGILTSTSALINVEGAAEKLKKIHRENPDLPVGIHLNLTSGKPVSRPDEIASLVDKDGSFYPVDEIPKHLPDIPIEEVRKELFAQVELFISTGVPLDHIDYHHHVVALYSPYFEIVRELAVRYEVPVRNPVPAGLYNKITLEGSGGASSAALKKLILFGITHPIKTIPIMKEVGPDELLEQEKLLLQQGIYTSHWFIDDFYNNATTENFISILKQLPEGVSEIMCHPGHGSELEVLTDPHVRHVIDSLNIELTTWNHFK